MPRSHQFITLAALAMSATKTPCENNYATVHTLICGHHVEFEEPLPCRVNCEAIARIMTDHDTRSNPRILCSACHFVLWLERTEHEHTHFQRQWVLIEESHEYKQADVVEQERMLDEVVEKYMCFDGWFDYVAEQQEKSRVRGDVWGLELDLEESVDELADVLDRSSRVDTDGDEIMGEGPSASVFASAGYKKSGVPPLKPLWLKAASRKGTVHDALATMALASSEDGQDVEIGQFGQIKL